MNKKWKKYVKIECVKICIHLFYTYISFQPDIDLEQPLFDEHYIPPPRLLNACRLFFPYAGYIDIGYFPEDNGYGGPVLTLTAVIVYKEGWIALNERQLINFIITLRRVGGYSDSFNRRYYEEAPNFNERFDIKKIDKYFSIVFTDGDGDVSSIKKFGEYDVMGMLDLENFIESRIEYLKIHASGVYNLIESLTQKCIDDGSQILTLANNQYMENLMVEIAANHLLFFKELIFEKNNIDGEIE